MWRTSQVDDTLSRLEVLRDRIEATEALVTLDLDHRRNELVAFDLVCPSSGDLEEGRGQTDTPTPPFSPTHIQEGREREREGVGAERERGGEEGGVKEGKVGWTIEEAYGKETRVPRLL
jgi:hypothetical protein